MAYCNRCGNALLENSTFCSTCGNPVGGSAQIAYTKRPKIRGRGFGISSMVLGIIGLVMSLNTFYVFSNAQREIADFSLKSYFEGFIWYVLLLSLLSILSLCFAPLAIKRGYKNGISISGLVLGIVGICAYICLVSVVLSLTSV